MSNWSGLLVAALVVGGVSACDEASGHDDGRIVAAAALYPVEEVVRRVGGDLVDVVPLVPAGEAPHDYEPTAKQLTGVTDADVLFHLGDFQSGINQAMQALPGSVKRIDLLDGIMVLQAGDGSTDPHVWLDPANMAEMADSVAAELSKLRPADASTFEANAQQYVEEMHELDREFLDGLASCASTTVVTGHEAFAYLARAYRLENISVAGISPGEEPSAQTLEDVAALASAHGVTTIFFEENLPDDLARTIADEVGAETAVLDPVESPSRDQLDDGATYASIMRDNLVALRQGLNCS